MKIQDSIIMAMRSPLIRVAALLCCMLFIGCAKEEPGTSGSSTGPADKAVVMLSVNTPQPTLPNSLTRSQSPNETHISDIRVLVFEKSAGGYLFRYLVNGTDVAASGSAINFKVLLAGTKSPVKLVVLANTRKAFAGTMPSEGEPEDQVKKMLSNSFSPTPLEGDLPMFGETVLDQGVDVSRTYVLSTTVLRAVARVDVVKELEAGSEEFVLEEMYVYRPNDKLRLIPDALTGEDAPKVNAPSVPEDAQSLDVPIYKQVGSGGSTITNVYIPESTEAATNSEKIHGATTVVIGGRFGGPESPVTYYRADFNSGLAGHPFGQVLRNHRYIFRIRSVSAAGWPHPDQAAHNLSSSITVDVQPWEDFLSEMYLGDDRFGISSRTVNMRYTRGREKTLDVESTLVYELQWMKNGAPASAAVSDYDMPIENGNFSARITRRQEDPENTTHIVLRTLRDNNLGAVITDTLRITSGRWQVDVVVRQDNSQMYSERVVKVLSVETLGNLGVNMVDPGASGLAMRKILDVQFSADGVIRTGGYSFTRIPNNTQYLGTTASANMAVLARIFAAQDVIYLPYSVNVSGVVADMIVKWLEASPHRVLIIGVDTEATNENLRLKAKFVADGSWTFSGVAGVTSDFARAADSDDTEEFFAGPFGVVPANASFRRADPTAGYNKAPGRDVTPLIRASYPGYENYMFFGINKKARIVYHGDAQLFQSDQIGGNSGQVSSPLAILMANVWAWITEQAIYGEE